MTEPDMTNSNRLLHRTLVGEPRERMDLTVVQWNVLADRLAHDSFLHAEPADLAWPVRLAVDQGLRPLWSARCPRARFFSSSPGP